MNVEALPTQSGNLLRLPVSVSGQVALCDDYLLRVKGAGLVLRTAPGTRSCVYYVPVERRAGSPCYRFIMSAATRASFITRHVALTGDWDASGLLPTAAAPVAAFHLTTVSTCTRGARAHNLPH